MTPRRIPSTRPRGQFYARPEIAYLRIALELHDAAECDQPECPVARLGEFLDDLEQQLTRLGDDTRAQLWASLSVLTRPPAAPL